MRFIAALPALLTHLVALSVVGLFCIVNSRPPALSGPLPSPEALFSAMIQGQLISIPLMLLPVGLALALLGGRSRLRAWFARPNCTFRGGLWYFITATLCSYALLTVLAPTEDQPLVAMLQQLSLPHVLIIGGFVCLLVPLTEELLFRGVLMHGLPTALALPYSSLLFALAHGINIYLFPLFLTGWLFAIIRLRSNSLITPIGCHAAFNLLSLFFATL